jgi:hypothetical protein
MPLQPQPRGARGTVGHPYSALNLRLVLAAFGLVVSTAAAALFLALGLRTAGWIFVAVAVLALANVVVVQLRRRARRRAGDVHRSLFE